MRNWKAVTHNDNANSMPRNSTAVADPYERSPEKTQRFHKSYGKHNSSWDYVDSYGKHHNEGTLSWNKSAWQKRYPGWDDWSKKEDGGSAYRRWHPQKVAATPAAHSMSPERPAFAPQAAECPVGGIIDGSMQTPPQQLGLPPPTSTTRCTATWTGAGWLVDSQWEIDGQIGTCSAYHPLPDLSGATNVFGSEASDETVIQQRMGSVHSC